MKIKFKLLVYSILVGLSTHIFAANAAISTFSVSLTGVSILPATVSELPVPLIRLGFNDHSDDEFDNEGDLEATFTKSNPPSWSGKVPYNGGPGSVDFGTTQGDNYVESEGPIAGLEGLAEFTVTGWVNNRIASTGSGGNRIVSWIADGNDGVDIVYKNDGALQVGINDWPDHSVALSSSDKITTDENASVNNWVFFAVTYNSSTIEFYFGDNSTAASRDGVEISYPQGAVGENIGELAIGHFNTTSSRSDRTDRMFMGLIDQVEIYDEALTLEQIIEVQKYYVNVAVEGVSVVPTDNTIVVGETYQINLTVEPQDATNQNVYWSSQNPEYAFVDESGFVTGVGVGNTFIEIISDENPPIEAFSRVIVEEAPTPFPLISLGFDEGTGVVINNTGSESMGETFTKTDPTPSWSTNIPNDGGGSSVDFGTTQEYNYVESNNTISGLGGLTAFTVTGWVNNKSSTTGSGGNRIVSWINDGGEGVDIVYKDNGALQVGIDQWPDYSPAVSSEDKVTTDEGAPADNWVFFAVTYNSEIVEFYFGDKENTASLDKSVDYNRGAVGMNIGKLAIGHFNEQSRATGRADRMFMGLIDQVEIFDEVLTEYQIRDVQNFGVHVPVEGLTVDPDEITISVGESRQIIAIVDPPNATNQDVWWRIHEGDGIATVEDGLVTGVEEGVAEIEALLVDGNEHYAYCYVTVEPAPPLSPLISLGFNDGNNGTGDKVFNGGSESNGFTFTKTDPKPAWSTKVPYNGGTHSVDFGTTQEYYYVESDELISGLGGLTEFTVTGWVNNRIGSTGSGGNRIVSWINDGGEGVDIVYKEDGALQVGIDQWPDYSPAVSSEDNVTTDQDALSDNWVFFAVTYNSEFVEFYFGDNDNEASLDGEAISYNRGAVGTNIGKLAVGHFNEQSRATGRADRMFMGLIDQVEIYDKALTRDEIIRVQNIGEFVPVTGISVDPLSITISEGETYQLTAEVFPPDATNKNVTWRSEDESIATVDESGLVTGVEGSSGGHHIVYIRVEPEDGGVLSVACEVTVEPAELPCPLISLGFNDGSGVLVSNAGSESPGLTFTKTDPTPSWSSNDPDGEGSSVDFGTTQEYNYVESNDVITGLRDLTEFTVTGWVNNRIRSTGSGGNRIVSWINDGGEGVDIVYKDNGALQVGIDQWPDYSPAVSSPDKILYDGNASAENWVFFAVTYNRSTVQFYFGNNDNTASLDQSVLYDRGAVGTDIGKLAIGHFNEQSRATGRADRMFMGLIDHIEIYDEVLTLPAIKKVQDMIYWVTGVSLSDDVLYVSADSGYPLEATVEPQNATNQNVTWSTSDESVVSVDEFGNIDAKYGKQGYNATITVKTVDGGHEASCTVYVLD